MRNNSQISSHLQLTNAYHSEIQQNDRSFNMKSKIQNHHSNQNSSGNLNSHMNYQSQSEINNMSSQGQLHSQQNNRNEKYFNEDFQQVCKILNIDVYSLQQRTLQEFIQEENNEAVARIRFEHYDKKRRIKLRQIQEFMHAMTKKSKSNLVTLSLIPKENIQELKKSKGSHDDNHTASTTYHTPFINFKQMRIRPRTHKNSVTRDHSNNNGMYQSMINLSNPNKDLRFGGNGGNAQNSKSIFDLTNLEYGNQNQNDVNPYVNNSTKRSILTNNQDDPDGQNNRQPDFTKLLKNRDFFTKLTAEERQKLFRLKSAKKDKKIEKEMKLRREEWQWKSEKRNKKIEQVLQKKKMLEMEDEVKRQQKLEQYFEKTEKIQQQKLAHLMSSRDSLNNEEGGEDRVNLINDDSSDEERHLQKRIQDYEEKMLRAALRKQEALEKERERIQSQHEVLRERRNQHLSEYQEREYGTLQRYCDRQSKSRKLIKRKGDEKSDIIEFKRHKEQEKNNLIKLRIDEQKAQYESKINQSLVNYQNRSVLISQEMRNNGQIIEKRVKQSLRDQDQQDNLKRILITQKQYKAQLMYGLMEKDKRFQGYQDFKKSILARSYYNTAGVRSVQNISINAQQN
eukprot:403333879